MNDDLEKVTEAVILLFLATHILYGTKGQRDACIVLFVLWLVGILVNRGIIKYVWVERTMWLMFILMCVGGPVFAFILVGSYFGWW